MDFLYCCIQSSLVKDCFQIRTDIDLNIIREKCTLTSQRFFLASDQKFQTAQTCWCVRDNTALTFVLLIYCGYVQDITYKIIRNKFQNVLRNEHLLLFMKFK